MDRILAALVRLFALIARFTDQTGSPRNHVHPRPAIPRILLVGYNGARNTGADVRVAAVIDQLNAEFGTDNVQMTLMTLDPESSKPYLAENVELLPFDTIFFKALLKACSSHDAIVICEGSMIKSKFANGLTLFLCQAAGCAKAQDKPCIAYGVEVGETDPFVQRVARVMCSDTAFIERSLPSLVEARHMGIFNRRGIAHRLGTDSAWTFDSSTGSERAEALLRGAGWDGAQPLLGIAPINPFCWPAKPSLARLARSALTGNWDHHYQKFYYLSWSSEREDQFDSYLRALAQSVNGYCARRGCKPVIVGMEKLDEEACGRLAALLDQPAITVLANGCDGFVIAEVLGRLDAIVTSRYHAALLSMARATVPIAVSMDERLDNLLGEVDPLRELRLHVDDPNLSERLAYALEWQRQHSNRDRILKAMGEHAKRCSQTCMDMARTTRELMERHWAELDGAIATTAGAAAQLQHPAT